MSVLKMLCDTFGIKINPAEIEAQIKDVQAKAPLYAAEFQKRCEQLDRIEQKLGIYIDEQK